MYSLSMSIELNYEVFMLFRHNKHKKERTVCFWLLVLVIIYNEESHVIP